MIYMIIGDYFEDDASDELTNDPVFRCHRLLFWIWIPLFLMHTADRKAEPLTFTIKAMVIIHLSVMMGVSQSWF